VVIGLASVTVGWFSFRQEIKTKYTAVFQQLFEYEPKNEVFGSFYKKHIDQCYRQSLRDALIMMSKTLLPLLYITLVGTMVSRTMLVD